MTKFLPTIFIISAPSGTGKTSIIKTITKHDKTITSTISVTTRKPRKMERNNIDYVFKTKHEFQKMINNEEFLEFTKTFQNFYGTTKESIQTMLKQESNIILNINAIGAKTIKKRMKNKIITIFIEPPQKEILEKRIRQRGENDQNIINQRIQNVDKEILTAKNYDYIIKNISINNKLEHILDIINKHKK